MKRLAVCRALSIALLFTCSLNAHAGAGIIETAVTPLATQVTYSTNPASGPGLVSYVGYRVTVSNKGGNTINHVRFTGAASVTDPDERAEFSSADGATCTADASDSRAFSCALGQLAAGRTTPEFRIFFRAPVKDLVTPTPDGVLGDCANTDCVSLSGVTYYAEGENGIPQSPPQNSAENWSSPPAVALGTPSAVNVKSVVPPAGGVFFTGDAAITTAADQFAVSVTVPASTISTTAELDELDVSQNLNCVSLRNFTRCFKTDIKIPDLAFTVQSGKYLTIVLRIDASNLQPGAKIDRTTILYEDNGNSSPVGQCASPTTPNADGRPCIAKAVHYKNNKVPGWTPALHGDFEWTLLNLKNGRFELF